MPVNLKDADKFFVNHLIQSSNGTSTVLDNTDIDSVYEIVSCSVTNLSSSVQYSIDIALYNNNSQIIEGYLAKNTTINSNETYYFIKENCPIVLNHNYSIIAICNTDQLSISFNYYLQVESISRSQPTTPAPTLTSTPTPTTTTTSTATPMVTATPTATAASSSGEATYFVTSAGSSTANGSYTINGIYNGQDLYINDTNSSYRIAVFSSFITGVGFQENWIIGIWNGSSWQVLYAIPRSGSTQPPSSGWYVINGTAPAPTVTTSQTTTPDPTATPTPTTTSASNQGYLVSNAGSTNVNGTYCYTTRCQDTGTICSPKQMLTKPIDSAEVLDPNTAGMPYYIYQNQTTNTWEIGNGYGTYYTHSSTSSEVPLTGWVLGSIGSSPEPQLSTTPC